MTMEGVPNVALTVDAPTLCNYFDISVRQLANYRKAGMPMVSNNKYNVRECFEWYSNGRVQAALKANQKPIVVDEEELKLRKLEAEAQLKEIEVLQLKGIFVNVEDAKREMLRHGTSMRNAVMSFPARTAPFLVALDDERTVRDVLDREIALLMTNLQELSDVEEPSVDFADELTEEEGDEPDE